MSTAIRPAAPRMAARLYDDTDVLIMRMVAAGATNQAIGSALGVTKYSVRARLSRLYARIGAANAPHAVALFIGAGVIPAPRPKGGQ